MCLSSSFRKGLINIGYKTIAAAAEAAFTEKKSEFIGYIAPVSTEEEAVAFIAKIRALHRKATHNCYAYIIRENNISRHSDDGEPQGTAGVPIFEVLRKEGLTDVCCVVTRYFGGILLGGGGLVRAYTEGAKKAVENAEIMNMSAACKVLLKLEYPLYGKIAAALAKHDARTESESFAADVEICLVVREEKAEALRAELIELCSGKIDVNIIQKYEYNFS